MNTENTYEVPLVRSIYDRCQFSRRSAWSRGVREYAEELLEDLEERIREGYATFENTAELEEVMLNGARNWIEYSYGGSALIWNTEIARRLCNPSELKKVDNGYKMPSSREDWCQCQGRALYQAAGIIKKAYKEVLNNEV